LDDALLARGAELGDTGDVVALALPVEIEAPEISGLEVRWCTAPETGRDANTLGNTIFDQSGAKPASDEVIAQRTGEEREKFAAGRGGTVLAYLAGAPVGVTSVEIVDGVARMNGGGVLESCRGRGIYRVLLAARLSYAADHHGATMALCQANVTTSSPILQRLGFVSYGQERSYRLPLV
jgi:GNAT superfamily N-acetyltransferase